MKTIIIIPARLDSSRLPNKVIADINGKPMIRHVFDRAVEADIGPVLVACGDQELVDIVNDFGQAVMTGSHNSGSDRIYEAVEKFDPKGEYENIVNLQGDMPFIDPKYIRAIVKPLSWQDTDIVTLISRMPTLKELHSESVVKCISRGGTAINFSRTTMDHNFIHYQHHGIYGYKRDSLKKFVSLPQSDREKTESLEQLRALDNGMIIRTVVIDECIRIISVDTKEDLIQARK